MGKYGLARQYGEGEYSGRTLTLLLRGNRHRNHIAQLQSHDDRSLFSNEDINTELVHYYHQLYSSRSEEYEASIQEYLDKISMVWLDNAHQHFSISHNNRGGTGGYRLPARI